MNEAVIEVSMVPGVNPDNAELAADLLAVDLPVGDLPVADLPVADLIIEPADAGAGHNHAAPDGTEKDNPAVELSVEEAAAVLGKSVKAMERSLLGRWGNRLPEGWSASKIKTGSGHEWRLRPPAGFQWRSLANNNKQDHQAEGLAWVPLAGNRALIKYEEADFNQSLVVERGQEGLLKELLAAHRSLAEERKSHLDDLQRLSDVQSQLLLIEADRAEKEKVKMQLAAAEAEAARIKNEYEAFLQAPWWKRLLRIR